MAGFVQIMELEPKNFDEFEAFTAKMREERGDALLANKATITEDRDHAGRYYVILEFDSYEDAMKNSNDPETSKYASQMAAILNGPPKFYNLDVRSIVQVR